MAAVQGGPAGSGPLACARRVRTLLIIALLTGTAGLGRAQETPTRPLEQATVEQLVEQLAPPAALSRSLKRNLVPQSRQIDLVVNFDFDSDRLQTSSRSLLESLAQAMQSPRLQGLRFLVEGHTDARGSARYNTELSLRRAWSVIEFLHLQGVSHDRLDAAGRGFTQLLNPEEPEAAVNRRVRIISSMPPLH